MITLTLLSLALSQVPVVLDGGLQPPPILLTTTTYAPVPAPWTTNCDRAPDITSRGDYGCHAIEWVGLKRAVWFASSQNLCFGVDPFSHSPLFACLNGNEASGLVFPYGNPAGSWVSAKASNPNELLAGAVLAMKRYETPVYTVLSINGVLKNVAIDRIRVTSLQTLDSRCAWLGWSTAASMDDVDHKCALFELRDLSAVSVDLVYWDDTVGRVDVTYSGTVFASKWAAVAESLEPSGDRIPKFDYVYNVP